jgi:hypothetical protein
MPPGAKGTIAMRWIGTQIALALIVWSLLIGCATPGVQNSYPPRRPDGTLFESHAELMQYIEKHLEENAQLNLQMRLTSSRLEPSLGSLAYLDFRNGFRDLKFGDLPTQDMRIFEDSVETRFYRRPSDDLTIGGAKVSEIVYGFYKGRFYAVLISTKGIVNSRAMLDVLQQAYGLGRRPNQFLDDYYWEGALVSSICNEKPVSHDATVLFQSLSLKKEKDTDEKAKARKGASGL